MEIGDSTYTLRPRGLVVTTPRCGTTLYPYTSMVKVSYIDHAIRITCVNDVGLYIIAPREKDNGAIQELYERLCG